MLLEIILEHKFHGQMFLLCQNESNSFEVFYFSNVSVFTLVK